MAIVVPEVAGGAKCEQPLVLNMPVASVMVKVSDCKSNFSCRPLIGISCAKATALAGVVITGFNAGAYFWRPIRGVLLVIEGEGAANVVLICNLRHTGIVCGLRGGGCPLRGCPRKSAPKGRWGGRTSGRPASAKAGTKKAQSYYELWAKKTMLQHTILEISRSKAKSNSESG